MTRFASFLLVVLFILSGCLTAFAQADPYAVSLIKLADLRSDFGGSPLKTYEDVNDITGIRPWVTGVGPIIWPGYLESRYNKVIKESEGRNLLDMIKSYGGMVYHEKSFIDFLLENFYLDAGSFDKELVWHPNQFKCPHTYKPGDRPHNRKYWLCMKGGWQYIPPSDDLLPDDKSCNTNKSLCDPAFCQREEKEDKNGDGDFDEEGETTPEKHEQPTNNVYTKLGKDLKDRLMTSSGAEMESSSEKYEMIY